MTNPILLILVLPSIVFAVWLFLHQSADVEQRIDKSEAIIERDKAIFDRDYARLMGDSGAETEAKARQKAAEEKSVATEKAHAARAAEDQRGAFRTALDKFLKPETPKEQK